MDEFQRLPADLVSLLALCVFLLASVLLIVAGDHASHPGGGPAPW